MDKRKGFSLIELLVVISIIALLTSIIIPSLERTRQQAREIVCQSNLRHWGVIFSLYLGDNEGVFCEFSEDVEHVWTAVMRPYYTNPDICLCPSTPMSWIDGLLGTFVAWDWRADDVPDDMYEYYADTYGSYGKNSWLSQCDWEGRGPLCWRRIDDVVEGQSKVPLLLDSNFMGGFPEHTDEPPPYDGEFNVYGREIGRYCLNRHNGYINGLFVDNSAKKIGLKELWRLKWNREFDTHHMYGPWPDWMLGFRDYP